MRCLALGFVLSVAGCVIQDPAYPSPPYAAPAATPDPPDPDYPPQYGAAPDRAAPYPPPTARSLAARDGATPYPGAPYPSAPSSTYPPGARYEALPDAEPQLVRVSILGALIAPGKADGRTWDGPGRVDPDAMNRVVSSLARRNPYAAAAGVVASLSMDALAKPDPYGYAQLFAPNAVSEVQLPLRYRDTFTPSWSDAEFSDVPLRNGVRIRVTLIDKDLAADDFIGTVELTRDDLRAALRAGNVYPVQVAAQSANQLLFVNISVAAE